MFIQARYLSAAVIAGCIFAFQFSAALAQTVTRGPYLQLATDSSIVVRWRTDLATNSTVRFGTSLGSLNLSAAKGAVTTEHEVTLTGLAADTRYYYSVGSSSQVLAGGDAGHGFATAPVPGTPKPTRILVLGDSGTANNNAMAVRNAYKAYTGSRGTDLWLMLGDNAYIDGTDSQYQAAVFDMYPEILRQAPLWPTFGNHDGSPTDAQTQSGPYFDMFTLPANGEAGGVASGTEAYYSFDYGNIHFINLDSHGSGRDSGGAMMTWLKNDLAATDKEWVIAYWHHPPYSTGSHNSDTETTLIEMRERALPILEAYGVDLVLGGHSHSYERSHLIDGHYGTSGTFDPNTMILDAGGGREDGAGAYTKTQGGGVAHEGAVYTVAGSSGKKSGLNGKHPAMFFALNSLGSVVIDVSGNRLDATFIDQNGVVKDYFTIKKTPDSQPPMIVSATALDTTTVSVTFDERLDRAKAENAANYAVDNGISVTGAALGSDDRTVTLSVSTLTEGVAYTLTVNNLADLAGTVIAPNSQIGFSYNAVATRSFQDGVSPTTAYAGTRDATLSQNEPDTAFGGQTVLLADGDDPVGSTLDKVSVMSWDLSSIPADAVIESASITINISNASAASYEFYRLKRPWTESQATWNRADNGTLWAGAGASGTSDRDTAALASIVGNTTGGKTIALNTAGLAAVQGWVDGSVPNYGVILSDSSVTDGLDFASRESSSPSARPKLTVTYSLPAQGQDTEPPQPPSNLAASNVTATGLTLSWQSCASPPCDNVGVTGYKVYRDGSAIATTGSTSYQDSGLTPATAYGYTVTSLDAAANESSPSNNPPLAVTTEPEAVPVIHVEDIAMSIVTGASTVNARARITVLDDQAQPVAGASVSGDWSGLVTGSGAGVTAADGTVFIDSSAVPDGTTGEFTFTIANVGATGTSYDPAANLETSDCITAAGDVCGTQAPVTVGFQDGVSPGTAYAGTRDATLSQNEPDTAFGGQTVLLADGDDPVGSTLDKVSVLSWDLSSIPAGAVIESASIDINILNASAASYEFYQLKRPWTESQATWNRADSGTFWSGAGASGTADRGSTVLGSVVGNATGGKTIALNTGGLAVVQGWVDGSISNHGVILADSGVTDGLDFSSRESSTPSARPKLTVTYSVPAPPPGPTPDTEDPQPPSGLAASDITTTTVTLAWQSCASPPCDNVGVTGYKVYRDGAEIATTGSTTYQDGGLTPDTGYGYHVTGVDAAANESLPSNDPPLAVTTAAEPPPPPPPPGDTIVMQVSGIAVSVANVSRWRWAGEAIVSVIDRDGGGPVEGATVTGNWQLLKTSGRISNLGEASGITGADGAVTIASNPRYAFSGYRFIFTVTGVSHGGDTYEAGAITSGSATVP